VVYCKWCRLHRLSQQLLEYVRDFVLGSTAFTHLPGILYKENILISMYIIKDWFLFFMHILSKNTQIKILHFCEEQCLKSHQVNKEAH